MPESRDYYGALSKLLTTRGNQILDIHFLPEAFGDLLHEGTEIGISKKALVQCFIKARQIFFSLPPQQPQPKKPEPSSIQGCSALEAPHEGAPQSPHHTPEDYASQTLLLQTEILLLLDSEHLTACNWRKRRLRFLKENQLQFPSSASPYLLALHTEISFTTTILRSPLHRHTKSPVLWYHRKWVMLQLLNLFYENPVAAFAGSHHLPHYDAEAGVDADAATIAAAAAVNQIINYEVSIVLQASTHHPKNYYAFSYLREFMGLFADALAATVARGYYLGQLPVMIRLGNLARMVLETLHTWCLAYSHRRDISAWSFLLWLLEAMGDGDGEGDNNDVSTLRKSIVDKTARFGAEVSWDGEGLWIFVDLAVRRFGVDVEWLAGESRGGDFDDDGGDGDQRQNTARCSSIVGDVTVDDIDGPSTTPAPAATSSQCNKRWKIWIRRMKALQERTDTTVVINDND